MPSHALDDPTEARTRRQAARRRRNLRHWRHGVLAVLVVASIAGVTGQPSFRGGATGLLAGLARVVLLDAVFTVIMVTAAVLVIVCSEKLSAGRAGPAPRWQYLLGAAG